MHILTRRKKFRCNDFLGRCKMQKKWIIIRSLGYTYVHNIINEFIAWWWMDNFWLFSIQAPLFWNRHQKRFTLWLNTNFVMSVLSSETFLHSDIEKNEINFSFSQLHLFTKIQFYIEIVIWKVEFSSKVIGVGKHKMALNWIKNVSTLYLW